MDIIKLTKKQQAEIKRPAQKACFEEKGLFYGALYLDQHESFDLVKEQVDGFAKIGTNKVYFDVIIYKDQQTEGKEMVDKVFEYIEGRGLTAHVELSINSEIGDMPTK